MDNVVLALALVGVYVAALLSSCVATALILRRAVRRLAADSSLKALHETIAEARTWNSRLLATIRWAGAQAPTSTRSSTTPNPPPGPVQQLAQVLGVPVPPQVAAAAAGGDNVEVEVPDALVNIARGAGVDIGKVLAGDDAEMAKAKQLLAALADRTGGSTNNGFASPGAPSEAYL